MSSRRWVFTVGVDPRQESTVPSRAILLGLAQSGTHSGHLRVGASPGTKEGLVGRQERTHTEPDLQDSLLHSLIATRRRGIDSPLTSQRLPLCVTPVLTGA